MSLSFTCDECGSHEEDRSRCVQQVYCETCFRDLKESLEKRIDELENESAELQKELGISEGQRETEAEVFATQIREKDILINELLAKVHAA